MLSTPPTTYGTFVTNSSSDTALSRSTLFLRSCIILVLLTGSYFSFTHLSAPQSALVPHQLDVSLFSHFVILQRHGKSNWENQTLTDFERPLKSRGLKEANRIGQYFSEHISMGGVWEQAGSPDLIACSPSVRTRQTLNSWISGFCQGKKDCQLNEDNVVFGERDKVPVIYAQSIYDARNGSDLMEYFTHMSSDAKTLLIVGHSTALDELVVTLTGGPPAVHFATSGCALLGSQLSGNGWKRPGTFWLLDYVNPSVLTMGAPN